MWDESTNGIVVLKAALSVAGAALLARQLAHPDSPSQGGSSKNVAGSALQQVILNSVVTTLLRSLLLMSEALAGDNVRVWQPSAFASPTPSAQKLPVNPSTLQILTY